MSAEDEANLGNEEGAGGEEEEQELGEGWVGVSRPAKPRTPPPVADRTNRPTLYSTMAVKEIDHTVFSSQVKSNRVWWTPEDDEVPDEDYEPFEVDVSDNAELNGKYDVGETTRRLDFFVIKSGARKSDGAPVSIKAIDKARATMLGQSLDALASEIELFRACGAACDYVCSASELCSADDTLCVVLEPIAGAPLNVQLARGPENYTEADARRLALQVASAVAHVHRAGVAHRDIVPDNFVFTSKADIEQVKLCDFSFARKLAAGETLDDSPGGDPEFQAPELARDEPHGTACDIWALGCLIHLLLTGEPPLHDSNMTRLRMKIGKGDVSVGAGDARWPAVASSASDLVKALLVAEADKRPQADDVLNMPWFSATDDLHLGGFKLELKKWNDSR